MPTVRQWFCFPKTLTLKERWLVRVLIFIIIGSVLGISWNAYLAKTKTQPEIGGTYTEGIMGKPRYINPILAPTNDADRDICRIVYSSLFKYNSQGNLIPDIAKEYEIKDEGLTYKIYLKENVYFHDGEKLTAKDIIYTIKTIQNPEYNSPLKSNWQGVKVEKIDEYTIEFKLTNSYAPFMHNLTVGILPKHLWAGISAENFPLAQYNLKPIGSGPYQFDSFSKDKTGRIKSLSLTRNKKFYLNHPPFIEKINFYFYNNQKELIEAYQENKIDGLSFISANNKNNLLKNLDLEIYQLNIPEYYSVFFNQTESKALANQKVRKALKLATNKQEILKKAIVKEGKIINSPLLDSWSEYDFNTPNHQFDQEQARQLLENENWQDNNNDGIREKDFSEEDEEATSTPQQLELELLTTNWPALEKAANTLKQQWQEVGVKLNLKIVNASEIQSEYLQERNYQILLFGQVLSSEPDPFAFWHSSQIKHPGLNLALYENKKADKLLEEGRQILDKEKRFAKYKEFQKIFLEDTPVIFLYSPNYLYPVNQKVKGITLKNIPKPSARFSQIENWYIKTKRIFKQ